MNGDAVHEWFGLTYAAYLVLPRSVLQSLPDDLQTPLVDALNAIQRYVFPACIPAEGHYTVDLKDEHGRFLRDPLRAYERGRRIITREELLHLSNEVPP